MEASKLHELIEDISENDSERSFRLLFDQFSRGLLAYTTSIVNDKTIAEEVVADVFVNIWQKRKLLSNISSLPYYLYAACKNTAINYQKKKKLPVIDIDQISVTHLQTEQSPESAYISAVNLKIIFEAIHALPPKCQFIFKLNREDGLTYKEIANILDISVKTVENQMNIAFKKIMEVVKAQLPEMSAHYHRQAR